MDILEQEHKHGIKDLKKRYQGESNESVRDMDSRVEQQFAKIETRFDRIKLIYSWQNEKMERSMEFQSHRLERSMYGPSVV